jgi:hypothetical protein
MIFRQSTETDEHEPDPNGQGPHTDAISIFATVGSLIFVPLFLGWRLFALIVGVALATGIAVEVTNYWYARRAGGRQNSNGD